MLKCAHQEPTARVVLLLNARIPQSVISADLPVLLAQGEECGDAALDSESAGFVYDSNRLTSTSVGQLTNSGDSRQNATSQLGNVPERFTIGLIDCYRFSDAPKSIKSKIKPVILALSPTATPP